LVPDSLVAEVSCPWDCVLLGGIVINRKSRQRSGRSPVPGKLDPGIQKAVRRLQTKGIETFESCEGGAGHAYPEPTIRFYGRPEAGWRALAACLGCDLPVSELRRVWPILDANEPNGPYWEVTFRHQID
jgi:hypothetical protein